MPVVDNRQYPTIALSDAFNAAGHALGAYYCWAADPNAAIGLTYVTAAAVAGVLRFGLHAPTFSPANGAWAEAAGFVGLPMVGHATVCRLLALPSSNLATNPVAYLSGLVLLYTAIKAYCGANEGKKDLARTLVAALTCVVPLVVHGVRTGNAMLYGSVLLFLAGGVVIGADRHRCIGGVRRENVFHYVIGTAAAGIGLGLASA